MELALTGEPIDAERAAQLGLVNRADRAGRRGRAPPSSSPPCSRPTARSRSPRASGSLVEQAAWSPDESWQRQREIAGPVMGSEDAREGAIAFAEKREPQWKGR